VKQEMITMFARNKPGELAHLLMLGAATVMSVYKPWGKTWFGRRTAVRLRMEPAILSAGGRTTPAHASQRISGEQDG
jgi:hypothetical protein